MATEVIVQVFPGGMRAVNAAEADKLVGLVGRELMATLKQARNLQFHRKFFSLLTVAYEMTEHEYNPEQFRLVCTVGAGYCDFIESQGRVIAVPKSISFAKMDQTEFERLYQDVLTYICGRWAVTENQINQLIEFM